MEKKQLQQFREQLKEMKGEIITDVEQTLTDMTSHNGNIPDPNDRATIESDREFELRLRSRERKLLDKIEMAIGRIDNGTYGICAECEEPIGIKRLQARPVATYCIDCKLDQERREKNLGK
ncbi:MAG: RNA polymerase-binding protein DksA [Candidatus Electrothrix aestuarii]|jgi:DnaK suppressor protein|uniref:RNA polymerase-binding transcription factor DksA n=1 Tax=Candidatus Electrothrix aestuarii TaxID=3062594 RepID=A0AAU8LQK8_9BACT|nr:RNA polymerase-binding protein DksA [Candidatus Electrothrix aestuarii]WPD24582.1 MAG: RNA polymerase-binding protein DksA [Candidatus Electrothrix sp. GW3-3]